jgi:hypothetical protein
MSPPLPDPVIDAYVAALVAKAPPLSDEQCHRIAVLLRPEPVAEQHAA